MKISNQYKQYVEIMKEPLIREVGGYLDKLMCNNIILQTVAYDDFGIAPQTLRSLRVGDQTISLSVLRKMPYVFAYYLDSYRKKTEAKPNGHEKKSIEKDFPALVAEFKALYGYQATFCLDLIKKGKDLREIVRHP